MKCVVIFMNSTGNFYYLKKFVPDTGSGLRPVGVMSYRKQLAYVFPSKKSACDVISKFDRSRFACVIVPYSNFLRSLNVMNKWKNDSLYVDEV